MPDDGAGFVYFRSGAERAAEVESEPEPEPEQESEPDDGKDKDKDKSVEVEATETSDDFPEDGTIPEVKEWIGDDLDRAQTVYDREQEKSNPRTTLLDYLDSLLSEPDDDDDA
jgi:hypothetical protein